LASQVDVPDLAGSGLEQLTGELAGRVVYIAVPLPISVQEQHDVPAPDGDDLEAGLKLPAL